VAKKKINMQDVKLTQYSHGAGCGCKIAPDVLEEILHTNLVRPDNKNLIVGNHSKDDAAVYNLGNGTALISTTDFFMPIVDDPFQFGRIASANAISDVYAMGGNPILAIAILGWPINKLSPAVAKRVIEGSRSICDEAGISLAGGHSIDAPEPIFGLAVNGLVNISDIKQNNTARIGNKIFLTKPLGVGILTTAEKKGILMDSHIGLAANQMMQLNKIGKEISKIKGVTAMTDVTGFGLSGHLVEMAEGSGLTAILHFEKIPLITPDIRYYIDEKSVPGGTGRNLNAYGHKIIIQGNIDHDFALNIIADPQTSGGLLIAVDVDAEEELIELLTANFPASVTESIGYFTDQKHHSVQVVP
jgi:selenide,water dikinase